MDIVLKTGNGRFNYRVCAIILNGNKILAMHDEVSPYFYLPGGRVKLHETAEQAVLRELEEELNISAEIIRPLWLCQSFFTEDVNKDKYHELGLYFLIDASETPLFSRGESFTAYEGKHVLIFKWLDISELEKEYIYPEFIKERIFKLPETLTPITEYR